MFPISSKRLRQTGSAFIVAGTMMVAAAFTADAFAEEVGQVGVDWLGNDIVVEAVHDPDVQGVTCDLSCRLL